MKIVWKSSGWTRVKTEKLSLIFHSKSLSKWKTHFLVLLLKYPLEWKVVPRLTGDAFLNVYTILFLYLFFTSPSPPCLDSKKKKVMADPFIIKFQRDYCTGALKLHQDSRWRAGMRSGSDFPLDESREFTFVSTNESTRRCHYVVIIITILSYARLFQLFVMTYSKEKKDYSPRYFFLSLLI